MQTSDYCFLTPGTSAAGGYMWKYSIVSNNKLYSLYFSILLQLGNYNDLTALHVEQVMLLTKSGLGLQQH